jgi:hypothetical protein
MIDFEKNFLNNVLAKEKPLEPVEEAVYNWYLKNPKFIEERGIGKQLKELDEFKGLPDYDEEEIRKDNQLVRQLREKPQEADKTQRGEIFEAIFETYTDMNGWFSDMVVSKTFEYDDRVNHTDFVLNSQLDNSEEVFIAVDCTVTENQELIDKKVNRIGDEITKGKLSEVKYFKSSDEDDDKRRLKNIPRVILVLDQKNLKNLCEVTLGLINQESGANKKFAEYETQINFLLQMKIQLEKQREIFVFLKNKRDDYPNEMLHSIEKAIKKISEIIREKKDSLGGDTFQRVEDDFVDHFSGLLEARL